MTVQIASRGTTGSSILGHDSGRLCRGRRIQMSGHSDLGIFNNFGASSIFIWVQTGAASAAFPAHPGGLEMIFVVFADSRNVNASILALNSSPALDGRRPLSRATVNSRDP